MEEHPVEERLAGGRNDGAWRVGDTVRKPAAPSTPAVHALLRHLREVGFTGAPRALGLDERGRQVLEHLDGETVGTARPWPAWVHAEETLVAVGRWLRAFHDAARTFVPPPDARWFALRTEDEGRPEDADEVVGHHADEVVGHHADEVVGHHADEVVGHHADEVVGHHDAAPYNAVWRDGELVGFVDWDLAHPADPLEDLAFVAFTWVPLTARTVADADGSPRTQDRGHRLRTLLSAYGHRGGVAEVLDAVARRATDHAAGLRRAAADGYGPAAALVAEGVADDVERAVVELAADRADLLGPPREP